MKAKNMMLAFGVLTALSVFAEEPYLSENLSVWFRADLGVMTNEIGAVTAWANQGTKGSSVDVAPHADNTDGHVAYEASGIGGKPSLLFDGSVYLKTAAATDLGMTANDFNGGAWFVVFKTPCTRAERANMGIIGSVPGQRFGAFFPNDGTETTKCSFYGEIGSIGVTSNSTQILSGMCWKEGTTTREYAMNLWSMSAVSTMNPSLGSAEFMVGNMIPSWMYTFDGEIAEIRIYNRPLTGRERSRIQFELCARYGVNWSAHGGIDGNALRWYGQSTQFGHLPNNGVPEELVSSVSSGGATLTLGTPSAAENTYGYFTHNGGNGLSRVWYVSAFSATKNGSAATFTFDSTKVHVGANPSLYYKSSYGGAWTKKDATVSESDGNISFTLPAGTWANGFYAVFNDLDRSLAMWHRADMGLVTNAVGCVTEWANYGTTGDALNMALPADADATAAHIAYTADGMGGRPALSFDGATYLKSVSDSNLGVTAAGGAWFVVCKITQPQGDRTNRAIFGGNAGNDKRLGLFFPGEGGVRGFFFENTPPGDVTVEDDKTQVFSLMQWRTNNVSNAGTRYLMNNDATGAFISTASTPAALNLCIGGHMLDWMTKNFVGDIAEIRVYNRPLTKREQMAIQFELCARYGVSYSVIDDEGLSWNERGAQLGYCEGYGLAEEIAVSATSGGATVTFDETPSPTAWTYSYLANNGSNGFDRVWYFFGSGAARALPMTFSVDPDVVGRASLKLYYSSSSSGPWSRVGTCNGAVDGRCSFPFAANAWQSGFYRVEERSGIIITVY